MSKKHDKIKVQVSGVVYSEKSIGALVDLRFNEKGDCTSAGRLVWFPKSISVIEIKEPITEGYASRSFITAPRWFLEKNNIKFSEDDKI